MSASGETILRAVRRAVEATGVDVMPDDALARHRLEARIEIESRPLICTGCGDFDWDED